MKRYQLQLLLGDRETFVGACVSLDVSETELKISPEEFAVRYLAPGIAAICAEHDEQMVRLAAEGSAQ